MWLSANKLLLINGGQSEIFEDLPQNDIVSILSGYSSWDRLISQTKSQKFKKRFLIKPGQFAENFDKQHNIFFVPKVLRIIFYP